MKSVRPDLKVVNSKNVVQMKEPTGKAKSESKLANQKQLGQAGKLGLKKSKTQARKTSKSKSRNSLAGKNSKSNIPPPAKCVPKTIVPAPNPESGTSSSSDSWRFKIRQDLNDMDVGTYYKTARSASINSNRSITCSSISDDLESFSLTPGSISGGGLVPDRIEELMMPDETGETRSKKEVKPRKSLPGPCSPSPLARGTMFHHQVLVFDIAQDQDIPWPMRKDRQIPKPDRKQHIVATLTRLGGHLRNRRKRTLIFVPAQKPVAPHEDFDLTP